MAPPLLMPIVDSYGVSYNNYHKIHVSGQLEVDVWPFNPPFHSMSDFIRDYLLEDKHRTSFEP
jgi:hypothetical protein